MTRKLQILIRPRAARGPALVHWSFRRLDSICSIPLSATPSAQECVSEEIARTMLPASCQAGLLPDAIQLFRRSVDVRLENENLSLCIANICKSVAVFGPKPVHRAASAAMAITSLRRIRAKTVRSAVASVALGERLPNAAYVATGALLLFSCPRHRETYAFSVGNFTENHPKLVSKGAQLSSYLLCLNMFDLLLQSTHSAS